MDSLNGTSTTATGYCTTGYNAVSTTLNNSLNYILIHKPKH